MNRIPTGLKGLDNMIDGGFPEKTALLVSGGPGSGKTLFALNYLLAGASKGEKCCYVSLSEEKEELLRACRGIEGLKDVEKHMGKNLVIEHINLGESITMKKFIDIISYYPKLDRLVIDNVNKLLLFAESKKSYRLNLSELVKHVKTKGSTLIICESKDGKTDTDNGESFECDGTLHLSFTELEERPMRVLTIHKMRYTSFEPKVSREFVISSKGLRISDTRVV
jgi:circadian clock protein KaiC